MTIEIEAGASQTQCSMKILWGTSDFYVVVLHLFAKHEAAFGFQNYGPIMVHESVPTAT